MKLKLVFLISTLFFSVADAFANDTAILYKQRLEQIKIFSSWLNTKPNTQISFDNIDTTSLTWKAYDTAFSTFFDKQIMDSLFQIDQRVLQASAKYQMQKIFLSGYDNLIEDVPFDSVKFKRLLPASTNGGNQNDQYGRRNTIIVYFLIDGKEYEQFGLFFAENSTKFTGMTAMGGDENRNKIVTGYIERLKNAKTKNL
jgi:hypothetical protein